MGKRIELSEIPKSGRASIRIALDHFKGRKVVDIRLWFLPKGSDTFVPSQKGITVDANQFLHLADAINVASIRLIANDL
ncbi:MAG: transcriptional coactivator p15/PC4 family protein [Gammaproteobacteria bacterium]|jgi:hypothetical protein|nr:transcriptional coactivator p15/PC4 family protein [Gammaproteobacteria bacterium]